MLNPLNYGRLEACQRLHAAGIVLETDAVWTYDKPSRDFPPEFGWKLQRRTAITVEGYYLKVIPAPSMAEVWRELLGILSVNKRWYELRLIKVDDITQVGYWWLTECLIEFQNRINPADALIDLLIWVEQRKEEKSYD